MTSGGDLPLQLGDLLSIVPGITELDPVASKSFRVLSVREDTPYRSPMWERLRSVCAGRHRHGAQWHRVVQKLFFRRRRFSKLENTEIGKLKRNVRRSNRQTECDPVTLMRRKSFQAIANLNYARSIALMPSPGDLSFLNEETDLHHRTQVRHHYINLEPRSNPGSSESWRAQAHASRTANPTLSPVYGCSWLRMATVDPALP